MGKRPLRDVDTQRHVDFLRAFVWCLVPVVVFQRLLVHAPAWLVIPSDLLLTLVLAWMLHFVTDRFAGVATTLLVPTSTQHVTSYSEQDSLVIRGRIADAADSYRTWIAMHQEDHTARLRLAALLVDELREWDEAERWYLEVRSLDPTDDTAFAVSNGLIDLYRVSGQREQLKTELARFAYTFRRTTAGADARAHLQALTREESEATP